MQVAEGGIYEKAEKDFQLWLLFLVFSKTIQLIAISPIDLYKQEYQKQNLKKKPILLLSCSKIWEY